MKSVCMPAPAPGARTTRTSAPAGPSHSADTGPPVVSMRWGRRSEAGLAPIGLHGRHRERAPAAGLVQRVRLHRAPDAPHVAKGDHGEGRAGVDRIRNLILEQLGLGARSIPLLFDALQ